MNLMFIACDKKYFYCLFLNLNFAHHIAHCAVCTGVNKQTKQTKKWFIAIIDEIYQVGIKK